MLSEEEKKAIEYLKARLYGNEDCKFIDIAQSDLKIFINLVDNLQKDIENWEKYSNEQDDTITSNNNKICDLEFKVEKQQKEIEELNEIKESFINQKKIDIEALEKKDKVINEMAKEILRLDTEKSKFEYDHAKVWDTEKGIKEYFTRKVEKDNEQM